MPQFSEKESSLLAKLRKAQPKMDEVETHHVEKRHYPLAVMSSSQKPTTVSAAQSTNANAAANKIVEVENGITNGGVQTSIANQLSDIFGSLNVSSSSNTNGVKSIDDLLESTAIYNKSDYMKYAISNNIFRIIMILIFRFAVKQSGIIYEDDIMQIGFKIETKTSHARLGLFYGNKTL
jgi:AP-2 complex subunit alpha